MAQSKQTRVIRQISANIKSLFPTLSKINVTVLKSFAYTFLKDELIKSQDRVAAKERDFERFEAGEAEKLVEV
jgi:hypothetical protein